MEKGISTLIFQILILLFFVSFKVSAIEITSVNFFQKSDESKLVIEFDSDKIQSERFHVVDDKQIILDIKNATAGDKVMRELDTSEFSGTVVFISPYKKPSTETDIRFAIQLRDNVRSILTQQGKKLILSIENRYGVFSQKKIDENTRYATDKKILKEDDATKLNIPKSNKLEDILENLILSGPKKYVGKKISLNVQNLSIDDVLKIIADSSGFNIILDQSVKSAPPLTLALNNLPWDQVLDTILELAKLVAIKNGNILIITTLEKATAERKLLVEAEQLNRVREPLITKIFPISFATIAEMQTILKEYITTRGSISADERTNS